ncbi:cytochrome c3 family protein [Aquimarina sp. 2201CG5-10]|uniref:cytochrome c3 family protein n=1 Tax=Aquimarina callyspongiae TaxID=3098150 RepID=UPI002AB5956A|nr:cytochrome c3 family protein [Aquimarina sp. 2201CG5-10]MDY8134921.1 cytochrome c3 family protein [Aquimarina sp. 2201CG5-10]
MNKYILHTLGCIVLFLLTLSSCKHGEEEYHSITNKIEAKSKNYHGTTISSESLIEGIETLKITEGEHTFLIPERKSQIKSYKCTECHNQPLSKMQSNDGLKKAHWDIKLSHADVNTMNCITCHNGDDMDNLKSLTGNTIDFNRSYKLCSQCHTNQFEDWKGGAHGKKVAGWAPPRASMTCVNCHDPHKPAFESRWPSVFNTQKAKERE